VEKGGQAQAIVAAHPKEVAALEKVDPKTLAALKADPEDQAAGAKAVSEISGVPVADVVTIATLNAQHAKAIAAAKAVDPATIVRLVLNPKDAAAGASAVQQVVQKLGVTPAEARADLQELVAVPAPQLQLLQSSGQKVVDAQAALVSASKNISPADAAVLAEASKAAEESPKQWRNYFWIAVGGEVVFIPLIFLLAGFWSPKRARQEEQEHEAMVERELAKLRA
jgi:MFS transporter, ACS family, D-galactonate transporter